jgi:hypothetical protein
MGRTLRFLGITTLLSLGLFALIAPVLGVAEATKLTVLMVLPVMWWARLILAVGTGRITQRFVFVNNANLSTVLSLTNPDMRERKSGAWAFYAYVAREIFMCAVVWLVMGGGMIYPRMAQALGLPH